MKCSICRTEIKTTFLNKLLGSMIKKDGKKFYVCQGCQRELKTKDKILEKL